MPDHSATFAIAPPRHDKPHSFLAARALWQQVVMTVLLSFALSSPTRAEEPAGGGSAPTKSEMHDPGDSSPPRLNDKSEPGAPKTSPPKTGSRETTNPVSEVVVTGTPPAVIKSIDRRSYAIGKDVQAATGSIADVLRHLPSVQVDSDGNVSLRGDPSVTLLIDGRPSALLSGVARGTALLQLPASEFDRVEVMTNPSAAFSPEGSGGIINLVRRKPHEPGANTTVTANLGEDGRENGSVRSTYTNSKLSVRASLALRRNFTPSTSGMAGTQFDPINGTLTVAENKTGSSIGKSALASGGGEYNVDRDTKLTLDLSFTRFDGRLNNAENYVAADLLGQAISAYTNTSATRSRFTATDQSLSYQRTLSKGHGKLSVNFSHSSSNNRSLNQGAYSDIEGVYIDPHQTTSTRAGENHTELRIELQKPLGPHSTGMLGASFASEQEDSAHSLMSGLSIPDEVVNPAFSDEYRFGRHVFAIYGTVQRQVGHLTALAGLRVEASHDRIQSLISGYTGNNGETSAFPSLHLSYDFSEYEELTASYSRRIDRPNGASLNPFRVYVGPNAYTEGNPHLESSFTDSFEIGYDLRRKGNDYQVTMFYRRAQGSPDLTYNALGDGKILTSVEALDSILDGGLELSVTHKLTRSIDLTFSSTGSWHRVSSATPQIIPTRSAATYYVNGSLSWDVTPKDTVQLEGMLFGRRLLAQGDILPTGAVNLGYRHVFNTRLAIVITVQNLQGAYRSDGKLTSPTLTQLTRAHSGERMAFIGLNYSFGAKQQPNASPAPFDFSDSGAGGGQ
jgi:outer membrane receptor for ferrienterochelin and colicin